MSLSGNTNTIDTSGQAGHFGRPVAQRPSGARLRMTMRPWRPFRGMVQKWGFWGRLGRLVAQRPPGARLRMKMKPWTAFPGMVPEWAFWGHLGRLVVQRLPGASLRMKMKSWRAFRGMVTEWEFWGHLGRPDCTGNPTEAICSFPCIVCFMKMSVFDWKADRFAQGPLEWLPVSTGGALEGFWTDWTASQSQTLICMRQLNKDNDQ